MRSHSWPALVAVGVLGSLTVFSCGGTDISPRDRAREQQLEDAAKKRREMQSVDGRYLGFLKFSQANSPHIKKQLLDLEIVVVNEVMQDGSQIDPMQAPRLAGKFDLVFGQTLNDKFVRFPVTEADFNPKTNEVILLSKERGIKLTGTIQDGTFAGEWISDETGHVGDFKITKKIAKSPLISGNVLVKPSEVPQIDGLYYGVLRTGNIELPSILKLQSIRNPQQSISSDFSGYSFTVTGSVNLIVGSDPLRDYAYYEIGDMNYDYTTGKIVFQTKDGQITLDGFIKSGGFYFDWTSRARGKSWPIEYKQDPAADPSNDAVSRIPRSISTAGLPDLSGTLYGYLDDSKSHTQWDMQITLSRENVEPDVSGNDSQGMLSLTASIITKHGWIEQRFYFARVNYDYFTGRFFMQSADGHAITGNLDGNGKWQGEWTLPTGSKYGRFDLGAKPGLISKQAPDKWLVVSGLKVHPDSVDGLIFNRLYVPADAYGSEVIRQLPLSRGRIAIHMRKSPSSDSVDTDRIIVHDLGLDSTTILFSSRRPVADLVYDRASDALFWIARDEKDAFALYRASNGRTIQIKSFENKLRLMGVFADSADSNALLALVLKEDSISLISIGISNPDAVRVLPTPFTKPPSSSKIMGKLLHWVDDSGKLFISEIGQTKSMPVSSDGEKVLELGTAQTAGVLPVITQINGETWIKQLKGTDLEPLVQIRALVAAPDRDQYCPSLDESAFYYVEASVLGAKTTLVRLDLKSQTKVQMTSALLLERLDCPALVEMSAGGAR